MKFLTPELFVRINEGSDDEAERLDAEWEAAGQAGRSYYTEIKDRIPLKLAEFVGAVCMHDAEWMGLNVLPRRGSVQAAVAAINVRQNHEVLTLVYDLHEEPQWSQPTPESHVWTDDEQLICLYDEVELLNDTTFSHEILLSNGKIVRLVFFQFDFFISRGLSSIAGLAVSA
jgi:hypothetical protein